MDAHIEIHWNGAWHFAARLSCPVPAEGYQGRSHFTYDEDYVIASLRRAADKTQRRVACAYPLGFELYSLPTWPAFMLDILPSGAGRRALLGLMKLADTRAADWPLLLRAGNPPGNLRIAEGALPADTTHPGFARDAIVERDPQFIEYAYQQGEPVAGSSGAQGDAPKFLLTQDRDGRWHADGVLEDGRASRHWLVKYPRGRHASDQVILRNEANYMRLAQRVGLRVAAIPEYAKDTLFVPRFDRYVTTNGVVRLGQESLCSVAGVADYGVRFDHQTLCEHIARHVTDPGAELVEYVRRDALNLALGNTDNHARNTALARRHDETATLTPLFDFAPMFLDEDGIPRVCRWGNREAAGHVDYEGVIHDLEDLLPDGGKRLREALRALSHVAPMLPQLLAEAGVDAFIIERRTQAIKNLEADLKKVAS